MMSWLNEKMFLKIAIAIESFKNMNQNILQYRRNRPNIAILCSDSTISCQVLGAFAVSNAIMHNYNVHTSILSLIDGALRLVPV